MLSATGMSAPNPPGPLMRGGAVSKAARCRFESGQGVDIKDMEPALDRVVRLAQVKPYQRVDQGKPQAVRGYSNSKPAAQAQQGTTHFGAAYHTSWGNVNIGDVIEFAPGDLWQVIPAARYPGYKPPVSSGTSTGSGSGTTGSGSAMSSTTTGAGTGTAATTSGTGTSSSSSTGTANTNTSFYYLQNWYNKQRYATLTMPDTTVVMVLPVVP